MSNTNLVTNLNSDLLDGIHGSYYISGNNQYGNNVSTTIDSNDINKSGFYYIN
ncbi:MAG: hypothetical protein WCR33_06400 [Bacilli bacterium]